MDTAMAYIKDMVTLRSLQQEASHLTWCSNKTRLRSHVL